MAPWVRQLVVLAYLRLAGRFRGTVLGVGWVVIKPYFMFTVHFLVFRRILSEPGLDFFLYSAGAMIPWLFVSQSVSMGVGSLVGRRGLLQSNPGYALSLQLADLLSNFAVLLICLIPIIVIGFTSSLLFLPLALLNLLIITASLNLFLSVAQVYFRDVQFCVPILLRGMLFLSPILYPSEFSPLPAFLVPLLNPIYPALQPVRGALSGDPQTASLLLGAFPSVLFSLGAALLLWKTFRGRVAAYV